MNFFNLLNSILRQEELLMVVFSCILLCIFIPPIQKLLSVLHEKGHILNVSLIYKMLKLPYCKSKTTYSKTIKLFLTFYSGKTSNPIYKHLVINKHYNYIRFNAISGSLFVLIIYFIAFSIILILNKNITKYALILFIPLALLEILNFFTSSDFRYFCHPETFKYKIRQKKK